MSNHLTFFWNNPTYWRTKNYYLPFISIAAGLGGIGLSTYFLYGREQSVYSRSLLLEEDAARELANFLASLAQWVEQFQPNVPGVVYPEPLPTPSYESVAELTGQSWAAIGVGITLAVALIGIIYFATRQKRIESKKIDEENPYIQALRKQYAEGNDNVFINFRMMTKILKETTLPEDSLPKENNNNSVLNEKFKSISPAPHTADEKMEAYVRLETDAKELKEAYHKIQIYNLCEYVIWNIMCMPGTIAVLTEFLIHLGFSDFDWDSEVYLTTFNLGILGAMAIVYAAVAIRQLYTKWNDDIGKYSATFKDSLTEYLKLDQKNFKEEHLTPIMALIEKNIDIVKSNKLPATYPDELNEIGFRRNDLWASTQHVPSPAFIAHEEKVNSWRSLTFAFIAAEIIGVLFMSNLYHLKAKHTRDTLTQVRDIKKWMDEWAAAHPTEPKVESFNVQSISSDHASESLFTSEVAVISLSIAACAAALAFAVYAWKHYQSEEPECRQRLKP